MQLTSLFAICSAASIPFPDLPGASFNVLQATPMSNVSHYVPESMYVNHGPINVKQASFCNVSLAYTHPKQDDHINVQVWLPLEGWNGRLMGLGGGGLNAGLYRDNFMAMLGAVAQGYAAVSTDAGHTFKQELSDWILTGPGQLNLPLLEDFASIALNDAAIIGKSVAKSFYNQPPKRAYWSGCSQGGRQGMMLAQKYPNAYDGIVASAPALNWGELLVGGFWTQFVINQAKAVPEKCELDFLTRAAISYCDNMDGVRDGIVSEIDSCDFNPFGLIGMEVPCGGNNIPLSPLAATVAAAAWFGPSSELGLPLWSGVDIVSNLTGNLSPAINKCDGNRICAGLPVIFSSEWIKLAVEKNPDFDLNSLTHKEYLRAFNESVQEFTSIIGTNDPDLSEFRDRGGKILSFHGLADPMIPSKGTRRYYRKVADRDPNVQSYYRLFEAPGLGHCWSPGGLYPSTIFDDMVAWVEEGRVPESLPVSVVSSNDAKYERMLCPYPQKAVYTGRGDPKLRGSYVCGSDEDNE